MQFLTFLLLPLTMSAILVGSGVVGTLQMDKNLQYNCYYQILRQYSTKSSYEYEDYLDYSHRLDDQMHLSSVNPSNNYVLHKHQIRREILMTGSSDNNQNDFSNDELFEKGLRKDFNNGYTTADNNAKSAVQTENTHSKEPTYFIVASKIIRAGTIYKVSATVVQSDHPIKIYANISCDNVQITGDCKDIHEGTTETLVLRIPNQILPKKECKLRMEGFYLNVFCDLALLEEKELEYSHSILRIFIQTDKPLYMQGDIVRFRILTLNMDFKGSNSVVEIYILDPKQYTIHRWLRRLSSSGSIVLEYQLPQQPSFGEWTIKVLLVEEGQHNEIHFTVEEYYQKYVDVKINIPEKLFTIDSLLKGNVEAKYSSGEFVKGNVTIEAIMRPLYHFDSKALNRQFRLKTIERNLTNKLLKHDKNCDNLLNYTEDYVLESAYISEDFNITNFIFPQIITQFNGTFDFQWPIEELEFVQQNIDGFEVLVIAYASENMYDDVYAGYAISRIYKPKVRLSFVGGSPQVFKPAMQFSVFVAAEFIDKSPVDQYLLKAGLLEISGIIETDFGVRHSWPTQRLQMLRNQVGIWELKIDFRNDLNASDRPKMRDIINKMTQLRLRAELISAGINAMPTELLLVPHYSPRNQYIKVTTSTESPTVGEYVIFHISTNFFLENFNYMVMSKGVVLVNDHETFADGMRTIALVASVEMAPIATIVVWSVTWQGQVVVDALTFPLDGVFRSNFSLNITKYWDGEYSKKMIGGTIYGHPGSQVGLSAIDKQLYHLSARNHLSNFVNIFTEKILSNKIIKHIWHLHEHPYEEFAYYPTSSSGIDAHKTFELSELVVITDGNVPRRMKNCNTSVGFEKCLSGGCFNSNKKCDGVTDCADGSDENRCEVQNDTSYTDFIKYRSNRIFRDYYSGLFWNDIEIGSNGKYEFYINDSFLTGPWIISGFSNNFEKGIGVITKPIEYSSTSKFTVNLEMPSQCRKDEHIGIRVIISNLHYKAMMATVKLIDSKDYIFVGTSETDVLLIDIKQKTLEYNKPQEPQQPLQKQQMFNIKLEAHSTKAVYVPIMPTTLGEITVHIRVKTSFGTKTITNNLKVETSEIKFTRHLSLILDLTKQNYLEYINFTAIPQITNFNRVLIYASGDTVGPILKTVPSKSLASDFFMDTAEENIFTFATNLYKLKYLRLLSHRNMTAEKNIYSNLNAIYQRLLSFLKDDGSFSNFHSDMNYLNSSVWLTAQCLNLFQEASSLNLENYIWIDPQMIEKNLNWLLQHQTAKGAFYEENNSEPYSRDHGMALTSHVLIAMSKVEKLTNTLVARVDEAKTRALAWIKFNIQCIQNTTNSNELAVTTYALLLCKSQLAAQTLNYLRQRAKISDGFIYWSNADNDLSPIMVKPRPLCDYNSLSIETTAYGLMVYVINRDPNMHLIINWLNANRLFDGSWSSKKATAIAICALTEYAKYSSAWRELTATSIEIEASSQTGTVHAIHVNNSISQAEIVETNNFWGAININAKGVGYVLLQFQIEEFIENFVHPIQPTFNLNNKIISRGKYHSHITYYTCIRRLKIQPLSDVLSVLDVTIPTGYGIQQQKLNAYILKPLKNVLNAKSFPSHIIFYIAILDQKTDFCINYTVQRWYPVANLERYLPIRVFDLNAPEYYSQILYDTSPLNNLSICDVCGSSKCSSCSNYSIAARVEIFTFMFIVTLFLVIF